MFLPCSGLQLVQNIFFITVLMFFSSLMCASVFAQEIVGLSVDVSNHQGNYSADNLIDGDPTTAWVGGGKGIGPGKYIEIYFPTPVVLESLHIRNGHQGKGQFDKFRRLVRGVILYPDESRQKFTLKSSPGEQEIPLKSVTASSIKIIITGVAPSSKDKIMGKAKVAVSGIKVYGTLAEGDDTEKVKIDSKQVEPDDGAAALDAKEVVRADVPIKKEKKKIAPKPKVKVAKKISPKAAHIEDKKGSEPGAKAKKKFTSKSEAKVVKAAPTKKVKKVASKKLVSKKTAPKKASKKKAVKKPSASKPGITLLRASVPVLGDKQIDIGVISPWLDLEFVAQIKRYFALLTTLHDSYPDVFTADIRERERKTFIDLQNQMRAKKRFGKHHIAMVEHIGLSFDKPVVRGDSAMVHVHGPYRYYLKNKAFEFPVDTLFSFKKENGKWLINGVQDQ